METDDLPPTRRRREDGGFAGALGETVGGFVAVAFLTLLVIFGLFLVGVI